MSGLPFPNIDPVALQFGPLVIRWYALAYIAGILLGWWYARQLIRQRASPVTKVDLDDFVLWATIGIVVGGRLGYVLFYNLDQYLADPVQILVIWRGGMSFHGGLVGVTVAAWLFARRRNFPLLEFSDLVACAAPIGLFFGRIANFINGELYGRVAELPWAMVFPNGGPLPRHPSQLYEALLEGLALFALLAVLARRPGLKSKPGLLSGIFLVGYGLARFAVEFVREPDVQLGLLFGPISMGQILSVPLAAFGAFLIAWAFTSDVPKSGRDRGAEE